MFAAGFRLTDLIFDLSGSKTQHAHRRFYLSCQVINNTNRRISGERFEWLGAGNTDAARRSGNNLMSRVFPILEDTAHRWVRLYGLMTYSENCNLQSRSIRNGIFRNDEMSQTGNTHTGTRDLVISRRFQFTRVFNKLISEVFWVLVQSYLSCVC